MIQSKLVRRHEYTIPQYRQYGAKLSGGMAGRIGVNKGMKGMYVYKADKKGIDKLKKRK